MRGPLENRLRFRLREKRRSGEGEALRFSICLAACGRFLAVVYRLFCCALRDQYTDIGAAVAFRGGSLAPFPWFVLMAEGMFRVMGCALVLTAAARFLPRAVRTELAGLSILLFGVDAFTLRQYHSVLDAGLLEVVAAIR